MKGLLITILVLAVVAAVIYYWVGDDVNGTLNQEETSACPLDAMQCPDGSYVGRVPPSCQFAACPTNTSTSTATSSNDAQLDLDANLQAS